MWQTAMVLSVALLTVPADAVPPPTPRPANLLALSTDNCPVIVSGAVQPYSPETYRFVGKADDVLIMVNAKPNLNLTFDLGVADETPFITNAGFGSDVRVRLPRSGTYELRVSAFDPIAMHALAADFQLKLILRDEKPIGPCGPR
jgi:hypothetical protein